MSYDMEMIGIGIVVAMLLIYLVAMGLVIANYILISLGFYKIAKGRNISNPWLAWIPFGQDWIIGSIADEYDGRRGIKRNWRTVLLAMGIITVGAAYVMLLVFWVVMMIVTVSTVALDEGVTAAIVALVMLVIIIIVISLASMAYYVCQMIAIYKVYESCIPEKAVKYMLLWVLVPLAGGICLLKCKDKGHPEPEEVMEETEEELLEELPTEEGQEEDF